MNEQLTDQQARLRDLVESSIAGLPIATQGKYGNLVHSIACAVARKSKQLLLVLEYQHANASKAQEKLGVVYKEVKSEVCAEFWRVRREISRMKREAKHLARENMAYDAAMDVIASGGKPFAYPPVPKPELFVSVDIDENLPDSPGIYFIWRHGHVVYVGKSCKLRRRCCVRAHENIQEGDMISCLSIYDSDLSLTESFYIGICRPERNFGGYKGYRTIQQVA